MQESLTVVPLKATWTPAMNHGTWQPQGRRFIGPVIYIQRVQSQPTGLFFIVSRQRYWWICGLRKMRNLPLLGRFAQHVLAYMPIKYYWTWLSNEHTAAKA
jgi:hypothetical protein